MRILGIVLICGVLLAACSGGAASPGAAAPSAVAPSVAASSTPSVAAPSVAPSASTDATNCMAAKPYALLIDPKTDWTAVSVEDREAVAKALEAYDFGLSGPDSEYGEFTAALVRDVTGTPAFMRLWSGEIKIVVCG